MAFSNRGSSQQSARAALALVCPRDVFEAELDSRIEIGRAFSRSKVLTGNDFRRFQAQVRSWHDYNLDLLRTRFSTEAVADQYQQAAPILTTNASKRFVPQDVRQWREYVAALTDTLDSLRGRLSLYDVPTPSASTAPISEPSRRSIFVVHGRNNERKQEVARFLESLSPEAPPLILHEEPNRGRTVLEKFEQNAAEAVYAVVLLTADDEARERGTSALNPRARQNVVFEFGFFLGALGRSKIAVLYEAGVELPSDMHGIAYILLDDNGGWRRQLARELRDVGIQISHEALLS